MSPPVTPALPQVGDQCHRSVHGEVREKQSCSFPPPQPPSSVVELSVTDVRHRAYFGTALSDVDSYAESALVTWNTRQRSE
jgi:hypothetical protein